MKRISCVLLLATGLAACGAPPRAPIRPGEDYAAPPFRGKDIPASDARALETAWRDVLAGRSREAERAYRKVLASHPGLAAAETGLAYAQLREGRFREAAAGFAAVLTRHPDDLATLIGGASAATAQGDPDGALRLYRQAQGSHPDDSVVRRRLPEVKVQVAERRVTAARAAVAAEDLELAAEEYRTALDAAPELAALRLELAELLAKKGDLAGAASVLAQDPMGDRQILLRLGDLLAEQGNYTQALDSYRRILARDPRDTEAQRRALETRGALDLSAMPEEFQRIPAATRITRADLAALVSVRVTALARARAAEPEVAVDISGSWAREHILKALSFDILPVYPNHTFQPGATVRRGDLARAVARVLDLLNWPASSPPTITDMTRNNVLYDSASRSVSSGLMDLTPAGSFEAWRLVSGREALDVIEGLARLVGP